MADTCTGGIDMADPKPRRAKGEGGLYQVTKNGRLVWKGVLKLPDGAEKTCTDPVRAQAAEKLRDLQIRYGRISGSPHVKLWDYAQQWLAVQEENEEPRNTLANYQYSLHPFGPGQIGARLGQKKLIDLTVADLKWLVGELPKRGGKTGKGLAKNTIAHVLTTVGQILDEAVSEELVPRNVAKLVDLPKTARAPRPSRALTQEQLTALLGAAEADPLVDAFLRVGVQIGPRPGELFGAQWENLFFDRDLLLVAHSLHRECKYTATDGTVTKERLVLGQTKTATSIRPILLPADALQALKRRQIQQWEEQLMAGPAWNNEYGLIFTTATGTPWSPSGMNKRLAKITEKAGIGHWSVYELTRHSYATFVSHAKDEQGRRMVALEDLAIALGHSRGDTRMARQHYIDWNQTPIIDSHVGVMEKVFGTGNA
jgi:integrase